METEEFRGRITPYVDDAEAWWPAERQAPAGAPNVLVVVLDDVGFAQLGCFGSDLRTPVIDDLAANGLRYRNFHTTALCSPTRACVLTGRNHHAVGMGRITDLATGFPGYDARIPRSCGFLPRLLIDHGYAAYGVGKWHLTPEEECHLGARRDRWPLGRGFQRYYGFFGGETHQFAPALFHDNHVVLPPRTVAEGYHLSDDLADRTIEFLTDLRHVDPAKPWFTYLAFGACHSPHQAPDSYLQRERGRFDQGWDVWRDETFARQKALGVIPEHTELSPRPEWVPAWAELSSTTQTVYARYMEAFAAFLAHADAQLGRVVAWLRETGQLDNTLIAVLSDNGASSEGGPTGSLNDVRVWNALPRSVGEAASRLDEIGGPRLHNNYPWGWTVAGNTPFKRWKRETHEGGVADPLVVHWPAGIAAKGEIRSQYVHAIDLMPTILSVLDLAPPSEIDGVAQRPIDGTSFAYTFAAGPEGRDAPERHTVQYYEMFGCRALYLDGWKAVTYHEIQSDEPGLPNAPWELYDLRADPSECHDLAAAEPDRLAGMIDRWWEEAERNQVLPLDHRPFSELVLGRPSHLPSRHLYEYWPHRAPVAEEQAPNLRGRTHEVRVAVTLAEGERGTGALVVQGSVVGGWSLHVYPSAEKPDETVLAYVQNVASWRESRVEGVVDLTPGDHEIVFGFEVAPGAGLGAGGRGTLLLDGREVANGPVDHVAWSRYNLVGAGLTVGYAATIPPADQDLTAPARFEGTIHRAWITAAGDPVVDAEADADAAIAMQ